MNINNASLFWHDYRYFPYEKELARREIETLLHPLKIHPTRQGFNIEGNIAQHSLDRLAYFQKYITDKGVFNTSQHKLESTCVKTGSQNRQSTRYSVHGLHDYRGKFNPQIVRAILNILGIEQNSTVIDPFCGSGTTLVECSHSNINALGYDINPMAVFISNAKLLALSVSWSLLEDDLEKIVAQFRNSPLLIDSSPRTDYLRNWVAPPQFQKFEYLKSIIKRITGQRKNIFLALASDLLRDYSLQEPSDLRMRRRKSPLPKKTILNAFQEKATIFIKNLALTQEFVGIKEEPTYAYLCDSRAIITEAKQWPHLAVYNAAITSPPYAAALPYIDTQRLSLIWLDLIEPKELNYLESDLTGSREFTGKQKSTWDNYLEGNYKQLSSVVYDYCLMLKNAIGKNDGFRRKAVPYLMYRYFSDMQDVFRNTLKLVKRNAPFALVIGHNHTTLGGQRFDIDTPDLLKEVAISCGWIHQESFPLQTYHRYSIHNANSVRTETLLILRKP